MKAKTARDEERAIEAVHEKFIDFVSATSLLDDIDRDYVRLSRSYGRNNAFLGWKSPPYREAIKAVKALYPAVSDKSIGRIVADSMVKLLEDQVVSEDADPQAQARLETILPVLDRKAIRVQVEAFLSSLSSKVALHTIFLPLQGIRLSPRELKIGYATLWDTESSTLSAEVSALKTTDERKRLFLDPFTGTACHVSIDVEGDFEFARVQALRAAQSVVDILNLCLASSRHRRAGYKKICLLGHPSEAPQSFLGRATPSSDPASRPAYSFHGIDEPSRLYEIRHEDVDRWTKNGLPTVVDAVQSDDPPPGSIPARIKRSVTWYSKAMNADTLEEQFVGFSIALEALLVGSEGMDPKQSWGSITQRLAEAVAFLIGGDCTDRIRFASHTKDLYGMRSGIVHRGETVSASNLVSLDDIVSTTTWAFVRHQFPRWEAFVEWLDAQKYAGAISPGDTAT
jgi:hypothetical protein